MAITPRQTAVLKTIVDLTSRGFPPSFTEVATQALGSRFPNAAVNHLSRLRAKGLVEWEPRLPRSLRLTPAGVEFLDSLERREF